MRALSLEQSNAMMQHLQSDFSTLRIAFKGGHRETLILMQDPASDGRITGETYGGNRIEFDMDGVASITYILRDEKVMTAPEVQAYKPDTTLAVPSDGPVRVRRSRKKTSVAAAARQGDEGLRKS